MPNVPHSNALSIVANQTAARGYTSSILTMDPPPPHLGAASSSWPQPAAAQLNTEKYIALSAVDWSLYMTAPRGLNKEHSFDRHLVNRQRRDKGGDEHLSSYKSLMISFENHLLMVHPCHDSTAGHSVPKQVWG